MIFVGCWDTDVANSVLRNCCLLLIYYLVTTSRFCCCCYWNIRCRESFWLFWSPEMSRLSHVTAHVWFQTWHDRYAFCFVSLTFSNNNNNNNNNKNAFRLKADDPWTTHADMLFCSCDLDLDPRILIHKLDLDILKVYHHRMLWQTRPPGIPVRGFPGICI